MAPDNSWSAVSQWSSSQMNVSVTSEPPRVLTPSEWLDEEIDTVRRRAAA